MDARGGEIAITLDAVVSGHLSTTPVLMKNAENLKTCAMAGVVSNSEFPAGPSRLSQVLFLPK